MSTPGNPYWAQPESPGFGTGSGSDVNRLHDYDDLDTSVLAHHHTLGGTSNQAAAGNHTHNGVDAPKIGLVSRAFSTAAVADAGTGAELKDTGIGDVPWLPINKGIYLIKYQARGRNDVATPISTDIVIRYAVQPASPSNVSPILDANSYVYTIIGGGGAIAVLIEATAVVPDDLVVAKYNVAVFYKKTSGAATGTTRVDQTTGARRKLIIRLDGWK